jgi:MSHA biogenesis protein MshQ
MQLRRPKGYLSVAINSNHSLIRWFCICLLTLISPAALSSTYSLPSGFGTAPFSGCTLSSGTTYTCGSISLANSTVVNITSSMTINASGFTTGTSVIVSTSQGVNVTIKVSSGSGIVIGNNSSITANLISGDNMSLGTGVSVIGNLSALGNSISVGNNTVIVGNLASDSQSFSSGSVVYGSCTSNASNCVTLSPLLDWHMDENAWNGSTGEVQDSSGHGRTGTAQGGASTTSPGELCSSGNFSGSNGVTGGAINLGIGGTSAFSFMAWVKWGTAPSSVNSWANIFSNNSNTASDSGQFWIQHNSTNALYEVALTTSSSRGFTQSATATAQGVWQHVVGTYDGATLRIFVNGVQESSTSLTGTITPFSSNYILDVGRWGFNSGPRWFTGQVDEVMAFGSALNATLIKGIYTNQSQGKNWDGSTRTCAVSGPDHVELVHNGSALTCTPKAITVLACTSSSSCNGVSANQYSGSFSFSPAAISGAQWCLDSACASPISGSTTLSNGTAIYLRQPSASSTTLAASSSSTRNTTVQCSNTANSTFNSSSACAISYASAGFLMNVPNHLSCTPLSITLQAVQASATSNTCVPAFQNVSRNVQLATAYLNPASGGKQASLSYTTSSGGASGSIAALSATASSPTTLSSLYFDNTGRATLTNFQYPDVGQVALNPVYSGSAATGDSGLALTAISGNTFIVAPAGFAFSAVTSPQVAGNPVAVTVTAQNACATPGTAPNFGQETTAQTVNLSSTNPQPALGNATAISQPLTGFNNGSKAANITWMEVGTIDLVAAVTNYLGSGLNATSTKLAVGRFIPSYFDTQVTAACNSFSYSGQPFSSQVTAHATGTATAAGSVTANYGGATWAKAVTLSDANGIAGALAPSTVAATSFSGGIATTSTAFTFTSAQTVPSLIALKATDTDSVSSTTANQATTTIRSGRLRALNSYGSDLLALPVPVTAQYWNGLGWVTNTADNCTKLPVPTSGNGLVYNGGVSANKTSPSMNGVTSGNATLLAGDAGFKFTAPGKGNFGYVDISITSPAWLMYPWTGSGNVKPTAKAVFGIYKSPLIYRRENY